MLFDPEGFETAASDTLFSKCISTVFLKFQFFFSNCIRNLRSYNFFFSCLVLILFRRLGFHISQDEICTGLELDLI